MNKTLNPLIVVLMGLFTALLSADNTAALPRDLEQVQQVGVLRHCGVPYANFVTGSGDGMSVELMQMFAKEIGVEYQYVQSTWKNVIPNVVGYNFTIQDDGNVKRQDAAPIQGDIICNGLTILPWRQQILNYSLPTFPTQVWLISRADLPVQPITPGSDIEQDIAQVKALMRNYKVLCKENTCLDPALYQLDKAAGEVLKFEGGLNELAPAVIKGEADMTILDVPDALVALEKWPGRIKVIGPVSPMQNMGVGFAPQAVELRQAFNTFLEKIKQDGTYRQLAKKYYPAVFYYYEDFFNPPTDNTAP